MDISDNPGISVRLQCRVVNSKLRQASKRNATDFKGSPMVEKRQTCKVSTYELLTENVPIAVPCHVSHHVLCILGSG